MAGQSSSKRARNRLPPFNSRSTLSRDVIVAAARFSTGTHLSVLVSTQRIGGSGAAVLASGARPTGSRGTRMIKRCWTVTCVTRVPLAVRCASAAGAALVTHRVPRKRALTGDMGLRRIGSGIERPMNWRPRSANANACIIMTPDQSRLVTAVQSRCGAKAVITDTDAIAPWLTDWRGRYRGETPAILSPGTTEEVAAVVALAREHGVPLVPQGGNTSMVGGATPPGDGSALILSTRRLNRIRRLDAAAGLVVAEAGVILQSLHDASAREHYRFPLDLGARGSATVGGLTSTNAGGVQVLRWGTMRSLVLGLEAVLPDGRVHDGLAALKKDNRGYDLNQLMIGSEGTLGVVTAATLLIVPAVRARAVAWCGVESPHAALELLRRAERRTSAIESFEIIAGYSLAEVLRHIPDTRAPLAADYTWHVLIEAVATAEDGDNPQAILEELLGNALADGIVADAVLAASEGQAEAFWRIRHSLSEAERASGPAAQHDISVPVAGMPDFMVHDAARIEARFPGTRATAFGHLGDGNVHFHVRAPKGADPAAWYANKAPAITSYVNDLVVAAGGSISAEHGIGQMKVGELARLGPASRIAALRAIKHALDPQLLFNPGKLVPLE
jgi:FAD/FMN-containing dehydrogenase